MGASGSGRSCTVCGDFVGSQMYAFEIGFNSDGTGDKIVSYQLHRPCLVAWELEREPSSYRIEEGWNCAYGEGTR
jgi:hypothetical protein